jgi:hypothetical protein
MGDTFRGHFRGGLLQAVTVRYWAPGKGKQRGHASNWPAAPAKAKGKTSKQGKAWGKASKKTGQYMYE